MQTVCGEYHPEIASLYLNLGMMYQEVENHEAAVDALIQYANQTTYMFGENHIQTAQSNSALAQAYYRVQEFRKALQVQTKAYNVFKAILPEDNPYLKNAKDNLDIFLQLSVQFERAKTEKARTIGINNV
jgi:tetratricopeptide (TPR) repeat protein